VGYQLLHFSLDEAEPSKLVKFLDIGDPDA
jgi:hypothetical protein